jgi:hypothetical protein
MTMKIALLLTGQIRNAKECFPYIEQHVIGPYNPDVYINTWFPEKDGSIYKSDSSLDDIIQLYSPKNISIEDYDSDFCRKIIELVNTIKGDRFDSHHKNIFFQFYKIYKGFNMIPEYSDYDMIIRGRFDLKFNTFPDLNLLDLSKLYIPQGWDWNIGYNDLFAFGSPHLIKKYCYLYENILVYLSEGCPLHPETILKHHLNKLNILPERIEIEYYLRGLAVNRSGI